MVKAHLSVFFLFAVLSILVIVNSETSPSKITQKDAPKSAIKALSDRLPFLRMFRRPPAAAAAPAVAAQGIDKSADDQWKAAFPDPRILLNPVLPDNKVDAANPNKIFTLSCSITMNSEVPEYEVYFEYGTEVAAAGGGAAERKFVPLGFYTYKTNAKSKFLP